MNIMQSFRMPGDDEFEDEPEDELASAGMHVVESDEDDEDSKKPEDELEEIEDAEKADEEKDEDAETADEPPSGLKELEEMEKEYVNMPLTIDNYDE